MLPSHLQAKEPVAVVFVSSLTPPPPPKTTALQNLVALPHRLFFFTGIVQGLLFILFLALHYAGILFLEVGIGVYHVYALCFIVFTQFFIGFLLTTFPRYLARPQTPKSIYIPIAWFINGGAIALILFSLLMPHAIFIPMLFIFIGYLKFCFLLLQYQRQSTVSNKRDTAWMLYAFAFGALGHILFILDTYFLSLYTLAVGITFYMYLFLLVMTVSQKMIPFFTANRIQGYTITKSSFFLPLLACALVVKVVLDALHIPALIAHGALLFIVTYELWRWRLPFTKSPPILWVLFLALWWAPIGFGLFVLSDVLGLLGYSVYFEKAPLHAIALGYFTTILIGFGTRIILGHAGRTPNADGYATALFIFIQAMVLMRLLAGFLGGVGYLHLILTSAGLWMVVFALWSKRYIHMLFEK